MGETEGIDARLSIGRDNGPIEFSAVALNEAMLKANG